LIFIVNHSRLFFQSKWRIALLFQAMAQLLYLQTHGAGMVFDFNGWILQYQSGSFSDIWHCFGYPGLHQIEHLLFFSIYKTFGLNPWAWTLLFSALHGLVAFLAYCFLKQLYTLCKVKDALILSFITAGLFLLSPMASETVVEKVTIHYFATVSAMLLCLIGWIKYHQSHKVSYLLVIACIFPIGLFGLELSYSYPLIHLILGIFLFHRNQRRMSIPSIAALTFPFLILGAFLILHKALIGTYIGHYGSDVHLRFDFKDILSNLMKYALSYLVFFRHWSFPLKTLLSEWLFSHAYLITSLLVLLMTLLFFRFRKTSDTVMILLWVTLAVLALAPVANLYFVLLSPYENDRYGYWASIFIYSGMVLMIWQVRPVFLRWFLLATFLVVNLMQTISTVITYRQSATLTYRLYDDFRWADKQVIALLDVDSYKGIRLFRTMSGAASSFTESLYLYNGIDMRRKMDVIYQMNYTSLSDGVSVTRIRDTEEVMYKVAYRQWGNWLWNNAQMNILDRQDLFSIRTSEDNLSYKILIHHPAEDIVFIYPNGTKWVELKLTE
jgi:hypothetical protein